MAQTDDVVTVELTKTDRYLLFTGLHDWDGPASCSDPLAQALGFRDVEDLHTEGLRIATAIAQGEGLSRRDWTRALASLEVMAGSSVLGSGEWGAIHGYSDDDLHAALKPLRRKLPASRADLHDAPTGPGAQPPRKAGWFAYQPDGGPAALDHPDATR